ncbi:hypothetical protein LguiA_009242 [Lonicera macranthoides]
MYGYFLKRVDQRFQLEETTKIFPNRPEDEVINIQHASLVKLCGGRRLLLILDFFLLYMEAKS